MGEKIGRSRVISKFVFLKASPSERLGKLHAHPSSEEHNKHDFYKKMKDIEDSFEAFANSRKTISMRRMPLSNR